MLNYRINYGLLSIFLTISLLFWLPVGLSAYRAVGHLLKAFLTGQVSATAYIKRILFKQLKAHRALALFIGLFVKFYKLRF